MTQQHHLAYRLAGRLYRVGRAPALALLLAAGLAGCRHKAALFVLPLAAHAPVALEVPPSPEEPALIATLPPPELAPLPSTPPPPPRKRPTPAPKEELPVQTASEAAPATLAIGLLSTGGDAASRNQQQAQEMIASILKRIAALPAKTVDTQKKEIRQIHHFLDQAQQALNSGDAEGANNLAIKARVLMDDLEKK